MYIPYLLMPTRDSEGKIFKKKTKLTENFKRWQNLKIDPVIIGMQNWKV